MTPERYREVLAAFNRVVAETGCYIESDDDGRLLIISFVEDGSDNWDGEYISFRRRPGEVACYVFDEYYSSLADRPPMVTAPFLTDSE